MGRCIIKINDKYFEWSTIVDAPVTYGMNREELKEYIKRQYGNRGMRELPHRLKRVEKRGASWVDKHDLDYTIAFNRAGEDESELTKQEIYEKYTEG